MYLGDVKAGQTFYYSVNFTPNTGSGGLLQLIGSGGWGSSPDWNAVAQRVANAAGSAAATASVIGAGEGNITLNVISAMDRASMDDLSGNLDSIVAQQPEVSAILGRGMIRLISSPSTAGGGGGASGIVNTIIPPALTAPIAPIASSLGLSSQQLILIVAGLALFMFLKK